MRGNDNARADGAPADGARADGGAFAAVAAGCLVSTTAVSGWPQPAQIMAVRTSRVGTARDMNT
jgi:hypothetical protein